MRQIKTKWISALLILVLVFSMASVTMAETAMATANIVVRDGPGREYRFIGQLSAGDHVKVNFAQGAWSDITFGNTNGYVESQYLTEAAEPVIPVIQQPVPVIQGPEPVVQQPVPVIQQPVPVIQQPVPVIQQPVPVIQQPVPVIQQPIPVVSQTGSTNMYTTTKLNVRCGPSTKYGKIGVLQAGSPVCVLGISGSWYKINFHGLVGYVSKKYVQQGGNVVSGYVTPLNKMMMTNSVTTVYQGTGRQYPEAGAFPPGYMVQVVGSLGNWYKVVFGNGYGYAVRAHFSEVY